MFWVHNKLQILSIMDLNKPVYSAVSLCVQVLKYEKEKVTNCQYVSVEMMELQSDRVIFNEI